MPPRPRRATTARTRLTTGAASAASRRSGTDGKGSATKRRPTGSRATATPWKGRLFDASGRDREVEVGPRTMAALNDRRLLWLDVHGADAERLGELAVLLDLPPLLARRLVEPGDRPRVDVGDDRLVLHVFTIVSEEGRERTVPLTIVAAPNVVATVHNEDVAMLEELRRHTEGDTSIGRVDAPSFVAAVLDWQVSGYFRVIDELERDADRLDEAALDGRRRRDPLPELVRLRRRITGLRRLLTPHREVVAAMTRLDLMNFVESEAGHHYRAVAERLERALDGVETARQLVLGSFEVHMNRTAQRTNDIMKVLTIASVVLLPGSLIAGMLGMNFPAPFFDDPNLFWVALAGIVALALSTLVAARWRGWF